MKIQAVQHIRRMRGGAQSHLMRCSDGNFYVVKFQNNPQHTRVLANDWLGTCFAALVGLSVPTPAILEVHPWLIEHTPELRFELGGKQVMPVAGLCFGSKYVVPQDEGVVHDYLPEASMSCVRNQNEFAGILAPRQMDMQGRWPAGGVLEAAASAAADRQLHRSGLLFQCRRVELSDAPLRGVFSRNDVYANVTGWESFEPWISRIENFSENLLWPIAQQIPPEWCDHDQDELNRLLSTLLERRSKVRDLILAFKRMSGTGFCDASVLQGPATP